MWFLILTAIFAQTTKKIILTPGQSHFLVGLRQIAHQSSGGVIVEPNHSGVNVTATHPGYSLIKAGSQVYEVHVLTTRKLRTYRELGQFCRQQECEVSLEKSQVVLRGEFQTLHEIQQLLQLCNKVDCDFRNQMHLNPVLAENLLAFLEEEYFEGFETKPHIRFKPFWEIVVAPEDVSLAQTLLGSAGFQIRSGQNLLKTEGMIRIQVLFVELDRQQATQFGLSWPQVLSGQVLPKGFWDPVKFGTFLDNSKGLGQVLAKPSLLIRNGAEGEFVAGGEIPIVVRGAFRSQSVSWKTYGIILRAKVQVDRHKRMIVKLYTEVSQLDQASAVEGIPGLKKTYLNTEFNLNKPGVILLSGLIRHDQAELAQGIPGLMDIPILGHLFRSDRFKNRRSDLFVLISPEYVQP